MQGDEVMAQAEHNPHDSAAARKKPARIRHVHDDVGYNQQGGR